MPNQFTATLALGALLAVAPPFAGAQQAQQVIEPQVDRREVRVPRIPSNDIELGVFSGTYSTQNFGASVVGGVRLGYHVTEDIFAEAVYAATRVSDKDFRQILPGGVFSSKHETLRYYNVSLGYNVLPGEVFFGRSFAKTSAIYVIGGIGSTRFLEQRRQTFNVGLGVRLFPKDWAALQVDMRDHIYSLDILGRRRNTNNLELSGGLTFFF